jgi:FkbM family methyltransferase
LSIRELLAGLVPKSLIIRKYAMADLRSGEPELRSLPVLCDKSRSAIDVGANYGVYSFFMAQYAAHVTAIEPNPKYANFVRRALPSVEVVEAAASDHLGVANLRLPAPSAMFGMATVEDENSLGGVETAAIPVRLLTIDSLNMTNVGLIKIDVEGHELAVLRGAETTIDRDGPAILIEAEERHRAQSVASVRELLGAHGYRGFFLLAGCYEPVETFKVELHQDMRPVGGGGRSQGYVNNFLFLRDDVDATLARLLAIFAR